MTGKRSQKGHGTIAAVELKKKKKKKKKKKIKKRFRIVSQPFIATYWMSLVNEEWYLCRFACKGTYFMFSVIVDNGGHMRGQTSRPVVGAKIQ